MPRRAAEELNERPSDNIREICRIGDIDLGDRLGENPGVVSEKPICPGADGRSEMHRIRGTKTVGGSKSSGELSRRFVGRTQIESAKKCAELVQLVDSSLTQRPRKELGQKKDRANPDDAARSSDRLRRK